MTDLLDDFLKGSRSGSVDPLDDQLREDAAAHRAAIAPTLGNPDEAGRANVISRSTGVPPTVVQANLPSYEAMAANAYFTDLANKTPAFVRWATDPRNIVVAQDDHKSLGVLGNGMLALKNIGSSLKAGSYSAVAGLQGGIAAFAEVNDAYSPLSWIERKLFGQSTGATVANRARQLQAELTASGDASRPNVDSWLASNLLQGVESVPLTAAAIGAGLLAGPEASAAIMGGSVGGNEYVRAREKGSSPGLAAVYGLSQGMIEAATEKIPASRLLTDIAQKSPIGKMLLHQLAAEIPGEQVATVLQDLNEWAVLNPDKPFVDYLKQRPMAAAETLVATVGGVGATVSVTKATERTATILSKVVPKGVQADEAGNNAAALDRIMKASAESKTRTRDGEAFKALVAEIAGDHGAENLYVPAETVQAYMQSEGYAGEFDSYRSAVEEGLATSGDVVIPIADAATKLAGTKAWDAIRPDVRTSAGGMSLNEAEQFNANISDIMAELGDRIDQTARDQKKASSKTDALIQSLTEKLQNAGFTPYTARQQAELLGQRAVTRAGRLGQELTGNEYDSLAVNQVLPESLAQAQKVDQLDFVINAMKRKADVNAAPGKSLLEFITEKGGVQDPGGDLQAMGAQDWHRAKKFRRKLVNEKGRTLDDLAQSAFEAGYFPGLTERPTINDLLGKIGEELGGKPVFANFASEGAAKADAQQAQLVQAADELRSLLTEQGIDPDKASAKEIRDAVARYSEQQAGSAAIGASAIDEAVKDLNHGDTVIFSDGGQQIKISKVGKDEFSFSSEIQEGFYSLDQLRGMADKGHWSRVSGQGFDQSFADGPRGRITFPTSGYGRGKTIIDLFQSRDQSTFLHETGHMWLEELRFDALDPNASEQLKADWQTVQDWFKANGHPLQDGSIPVEAHELWARGVERYLMEGKAPSPALRKMFETFKSWLVQVYRTVAKLNSPITDDVRAVMDRLIASDEEIAAAAEEQAVIAAFTEKPLTMSDAEWKDYQGLVQGGRDEAQSQMLAKVMGAIKRRVTKEYQEQRATVEEEARAEIDNRPEFRALKQLRETPMDQAIVADIYGPDALSMLPKQVPPVYKANGVSPNDVAELSGFTSADEMVRTLMGVETARQQLREGGDQRSVRAKMIAQETDARMLDRYGDPFTDGSIEEEALAAIHNDKAGEVMAAELRVLSRGTRNRPTPYSVAKAWAAKTIREGTVNDTTSRTALQRYRRAAAKAGKASVDAILSGNADEAFRQKQAQMLNNALLTEGKRVADDVDSAVKRLSNWAKRKTVKSVDQDYLERAQALLAAVDMRPRSQASIDKQAGFEAWSAEQEALGHDIVVPGSFAASLGTTHWSRLSVDQFLGLDAAVSQIIHLGKLKQTLLDGKEARDFEEIVKEAEGQGDRIGRKPPSTDLLDPSWSDKMKAGALTFDASLLKMETVVDWLDEGKSDGVFNRIVFRPIAEAEAKERAMLNDYYGRIRSTFEEVGKAQLNRWQETANIPELQSANSSGKIVRSKLIMMALNMGNAGNVQRLTDGYGWNEQTVREVLNRELTAEDWQFVQKVWDIVDTLWPDIAALERRVNGVEPEKVEATPVITPHGTLAGGYFPAIYDATKDYGAETNAGKANDLFEAGFVRSTTRASSTKERAQKVKRPILLNLGVINRHLGEVIHDITHREAVMNADKFLSSPRVKSMIDETLSPEHRKMFRPWLKFIANQWAMERAGNEGLGKFLQKLRANTTVVGMGFRFTTILNQLAGYSNSFENVGAKWVSAAIAQTARSPIETARFVLDRSAEVKGRLDTLDRDINATMRQMARSNKAGDTLTAAKRFAFHGIGYMDRVVVVPTWLGAYNKALAAGKDEAAAIYEGDKAVRVSQGSGSAKDLAAVQRGRGVAGEAGKLMTMFYSYMSSVYQRQRTLGRDVKRAGASDIPALISRAWWLLIVPPILSQILSGNGPDDDEDWGTWSFKQMLFNALGPIPGVRDVAQPLWDKAAGNHSFDYQLSPVQRAGQTFVNVAGDAGRIFRGDDTAHATRDVLEAAGYATGLVPGQLAASTQFLVDLGEGDADPQTLNDWYTGLTKGRIKAD